MDFPSVYYIDTEGGARMGHYIDRLRAGGGVYMGPDEGSNDFPIVLEQVLALATTEHPYRTIVIDSLSKLFNTAVDIEYEEMAKSRDMSKSFGAERKKAIAFTRRLIRWIDQIDLNVVLIAHEKPLWKDGQQLGVTFDAFDKIEFELDLVMNIVKAGPQRIARIGKSRLLQFPESESFPWSYAEIAKRFGEDVVEGKVTRIQLATPEQVQQITHLVKAVNLDQETQDKWLDKAGATTWNQMPADAVSKCIQFLMNKLTPSQESA